MDFLIPQGEPALLPPNSVSWRIFKNPIALFIGGVTAVLLELAEPRVRDAIWQHSTFLSHALRRHSGLSTRKRRSISGALTNGCRVARSRASSASMMTGRSFLAWSSPAPGLPRATSQPLRRQSAPATASAWPNWSAAPVDHRRPPRMRTEALAPPWPEPTRVIRRLCRPIITAS
ncbi:oxygenase MpaB family protein [Mesorhizobium sp. M0296]|uniref:oxygenase MpaB family protein n=1 Tax=Mesorhizobium sp. M0296 TaxID=2956931 RepID=UPI00333BF54E